MFHTYLISTHGKPQVERLNSHATLQFAINEFTDYAWEDSDESNKSFTLQIVHDDGSVVAVGFYLPNGNLLWTLDDESVQQYRKLETKDSYTAELVS